MEVADTGLEVMEEDIMEMEGKTGGGEGKGADVASSITAWVDDEKVLAQRFLVCMGYNRDITCRNTRVS